MNTESRFTMTEQKKEEFTQRIAAANKTEMVVIVMDIALSYMDDAAAAIGGDASGFDTAIAKARKCIDDLINALNYDIEFSYKLLSLYTYVNKRLIMCRLNESLDELMAARAVVEGLREGFNQIVPQDRSKAMMEQTQHIMAGMTYGKGVLNENVVNSSMGREFSV